MDCRPARQRPRGRRPPAGRSRHRARGEHPERPPRGPRPLVPVAWPAPAPCPGTPALSAAARVRPCPRSRARASPRPVREARPRCRPGRRVLSPTHRRLHSTGRRRRRLSRSRPPRCPRRAHRPGCPCRRRPRPAGRPARVPPALQEVPQPPDHRELGRHGSRAGRGLITVPVRRVAATPHSSTTLSRRSLSEPCPVAPVASDAWSVSRTAE